MYEHTLLPQRFEYGHVWLSEAVAEGRVAQLSAMHVVDSAQQHENLHDRRTFALIIS